MRTGWLHSGVRRHRDQGGPVRGAVLGLVAQALIGCSNEAAPGSPTYEEPREPCAARTAERRLLFGDLHVHTGNSFDAHAFDVGISPRDAYRFARGETLWLPPLGADGKGTQPVRLSRPLDFAAVTDHSEFLGEVETCAIPGSSGYLSATCATYRQGGARAVARLGLTLAFPDPMRASDVCGEDGQGCGGLAGAVWQRTQAAANEAYDKTSQCGFTALIGYEYSAAPNLSTMHRNVIFANDRVPAPTTYFEQQTAEGLWQELRSTCSEAGTGCDVLAIPHNSNESNGLMFRLEGEETASLSDDEKRVAAQRRAAMEPLVEVYQHKGDSECMNEVGLGVGAPDELCGFEKSRRAFVDCGEGVGMGGTMRTGCFSRRDFVRYALLEGLKQEQALGVNPLRMGLLASTDTHNGTPGATDEKDFIGHRGTDDDTVEKRLSTGGITPGGIEFSPGGLVGVWAHENSRLSLFQALRRREVMGTSGPRISVRMFGGFGLDKALCSDAALVQKGDAQGVPMGGVLSRTDQQAGAPLRLVVTALRDPGDGQKQGTKLEAVQIVKGSLVNGKPTVWVMTIAGKTPGLGTVDLSSCQVSGHGEDALCGTWEDPDFDPAVPAFYYARIIESPSCRWSTYACLATPVERRPASCADASVPKIIQERAWTSPIFYAPSRSN